MNRLLKLEKLNKLYNKLSSKIKDSPEYLIMLFRLNGFNLSGEDSFHKSTYLGKNYNIKIGKNKIFIEGKLSNQSLDKYEIISKENINLLDKILMEDTDNLIRLIEDTLLIIDFVSIPRKLYTKPKLYIKQFNELPDNFKRMVLSNITVQELMVEKGGIKELRELLYKLIEISNDTFTKMLYNKVRLTTKVFNHMDGDKK